MTLDLLQFHQSLDPTRPLAIDNAQDRQYYIDFSSVRGENLIQALRDKIVLFSRGKPTCQLFTGHIGCGKSTELLVLKTLLQKANFHVVYFESNQYLEMGDVDISDILLSIARQVLDSLQENPIDEPRGLKKILVGAANLLQTELDIAAEATLPGIGSLSASTDGDFSLDAGIPGLAQVSANSEDGISLVALGIGKLTAKTKNSPDLRSKLRQYLEPRTASLIDIINQELLQPADSHLKRQGKEGLVVIVDNLDRVETILRTWGRPQPEYLFVDRGEQLRQLHCHMVYTIPLGLIFSNDYGRLTERFSIDPKVLPMIPVRDRNNNPCHQGMALLRQLILARAFPHIPPEQRLHLIPEIFDSPTSLDRLCHISGGHVRELLRLLNEWIEKERQLPLSRAGLERAIRSRCNQMQLSVDTPEQTLLQQVQTTQEVRGHQGYEVLIRSRFVYEYRDPQGSWFAINPILAETQPTAPS